MNPVAKAFILNQIEFILENFKQLVEDTEQAYKNGDLKLVADLGAAGIVVNDSAWVLEQHVSIDQANQFADLAGRMEAVFARMSNTPVEYN